MVVFDFNRKSGIKLKDMGSAVLIITLEETQLEISRMSKKEYSDRGFKEAPGYPLEKAVNHYFNHQAGISSMARRELMQLLKGNGIDVTEVTSVGHVESKGKVRDVIWDVADKAWEAAGKPKDKKLILALRKAIMEDLELNHNVKKTSASNELGNWQKARI